MSHRRAGGELGHLRPARPRLLRLAGERAIDDEIRHLLHDHLEIERRDAIPLEVGRRGIGEPGEEEERAARLQRLERGVEPRVRAEHCGVDGPVGGLGAVAEGELEPVRERVGGKYVVSAPDERLDEEEPGEAAADDEDASARDALDRVPPTHPEYAMALFKRAQVSVLLREPDQARRIDAARAHADPTTKELIARERLFR